jgi:hypothetical protein
MTTDTLKKKTERYLTGKSLPAETKQIQNWLSCIDHKKDLSKEERLAIEQEILAEVQAYTAYPLFFPKPEPWWRKFTATF